MSKSRQWSATITFRKVAYHRVSSKKQHHGDGHPLNGLLVCGHCERPLVVMRGHGKKNIQSTRYVCMNAEHRGTECARTRLGVTEKDILSLILDKLPEHARLLVTPQTLPDTLRANRCRVVCWWTRKGSRRWALDYLQVQQERTEGDAPETSTDGGDGPRHPSDPALPNGQAAQSTPAESRTKVCGYLRVGKADDQDGDLHAQTEAILQLAEREGYEVIEWYADKGCSGGKAAKRLGWLKMLSDAPTAEWTVILCYDRSRFSRFDSIEEGFVKQMLQEVGKKLHTVVEGLMDWTTSTGCLIDTIRAHESTEYSRKLALASLEGKRRRPEGTFFGGVVPYGYASIVTGPDGVVHHISRRQHFRVPKGWTRTIVPGETEEVEAVRWIFETYASAGASFQSLADQLKAKGAPPPNGEWRASTIVHLLSNDIYVGDTRFGRRSSGKFYRLEGDKVVKADPGTPANQQNGLVRKNTHEPIISREVWDCVQQKLNQSNPK